MALVARVRQERSLSALRYPQSSCFLPTRHARQYVPLGFVTPAARILCAYIVRAGPETLAWILMKCRVFSAIDRKFLTYDLVDHIDPQKSVVLLLPVWCVGVMLSIAPHPDPALKETLSVVIPIKNDN